MFDIHDVIEACKAHKPKRKVKPEAVILRQCMDWLEKNGIFAWRQSVGAYEIRDERIPAFGGSVANRPRRISFGRPGSADITGILPSGRRLEIEVKSEAGRQRPDQRKFQQRIEENGGLYLLVRSRDEMSEAIRVELGVANG